MNTMFHSSRALVATAFVLALTACAPTAQTNTGQVTANGIRIAYERHGSVTAETVLLIAGTGRQLTDWPPELIRALVAKGYGVVTFDNRDVGLSSHMDAAGLPDAAAIEKALKAGVSAPLPYTFRDMARDAIGLLDALKVRKAHVVGMSMGGTIAQFMVLEHPKRVASLTLLMSDSGNPDLPVIAHPEAFAKVPPLPASVDRQAFIAYDLASRKVLNSPGYPTPLEELRRNVERDVQRAYAPDGLTRQLTVSFVDNLQTARKRFERLSQISVPTSVIHGADDPIIPVQTARDFATRITGADSKVIKGLGHDLPAALVPVFVQTIVGAATRGSR